MATKGPLAGRRRRPAKMAAGRDWHVPMPVGFRRASGLTPAAIDVLTAICAAARGKPSCWVGNEAIAEGTGLPLRRVKAAIVEMEAKGWIVRWFDVGRRGRKTLRAGFVLLKRPDADFHPVSGPTGAEIEAAFSAMMERRRATAQGRRLFGAGDASRPPN